MILEVNTGWKISITRSGNIEQALVETGWSFRLLGIIFGTYIISYTRK